MGKTIIILITIYFISSKRNFKSKKDVFIGDGDEYYSLFCGSLGEKVNAMILHGVFVCTLL